MKRQLLVLSGWVLAAMSLLLAGPDLSALPRHPSSFQSWWSWLCTDPERALLVGIAAVAWVVLLWLGLGVALCALAAWSGRNGRWARRCAHRVLPPLARRAIEATLGATLAVGAATPAFAATSTGVPPLQRPVTQTIQLAPLSPVPPPVLAAPEVPSARPPLPAQPPDPVLGSVPTDDRPGSAEEIVVHRGDCLWNVVARAMGPGASDADVARAWPRWFERNRAVIGSDPGLLLPGQRLIPPSAG